jgi:acetyl-CoA C-acetyltransferase
MAYPALGLCDIDGNRDFVERALADDLPITVNPSGGAQVANPVSATALVRIAEAALQCGVVPAEDNAPMCASHSPPGQGGATQFSTVCLLGSESP